MRGGGQGRLSGPQPQNGLWHGRLPGPSWIHVLRRPHLRCRGKPGESWIPQGGLKHLEQDPGVLLCKHEGDGAYRWVQGVRSLSLHREIRGPIKRLENRVQVRVGCEGLQTEGRGGGGGRSSQGDASMMEEHGVRAGGNGGVHVSRGGARGRGTRDGCRRRRRLRSCSHLA